MASRDTRTLKDRAAVARDKGKHKQALKEYLELEAREPADGEWSRRAAEMYRRLGKNADAMAALERAVDKYVQAGFLVKASAACRMILQMDPGNTAVQDRLDSLEAERTGVGMPPGMGARGGQASLPAEPVSAVEPAPPRPATVEPTQVEPVRAEVAPAPREPMLPARPGPGLSGRSVPARELIEEVPTVQGPSGLMPTPRGDFGGQEAEDDDIEVLSMDALEELEAELVSDDTEDVEDFELELGASGAARQATVPDPRAGMDFALERDRDDGPDMSFDVGSSSDPEPSTTYELDMDDALDGLDLDFLSNAKTQTIVPSEGGAPSLGAGGIPGGQPPSAEARRVLQQMELFTGLGPAVLQRLMNQVVQGKLEPGQILFREGERGDAMYVVVEGAVSVISEGPPQMEIASLGPGEFFGEVALLTDHARTATIQAHAHQGAQVVTVARKAVNEVLHYAPAVQQSMQQRLRDRLVEKLTATSPLFAPFIGAERRELAARFRFVEVEAGGSVLEQGAKARGFYVLLSGALELLHGIGRARVIGAMRPGDTCGEISLLDNAPAEVTVRAASNAFLLELPAQAFREIIMTHPQVLMVVSDLADAKRRQLDELGAGGGQAGNMQML